MNNYYTYILLNGQYTNINNNNKFQRYLIEAIIKTENLYVLEDNELGIILVNLINLNTVKTSKENIENKTGIIYFMVPIKYFDGTLIKEYHFK